VNLQADTLVVCLLPWHVVSVKQDSGLTRHDTTTHLFSGISLYAVAAGMPPTDAYHVRPHRWSTPPPPLTPRWSAMIPSRHLTPAGQLDCGSLFNYLILPPSDFPRHHCIRRHTQRPSGGEVWVPDCKVHFVHVNLDYVYFVTITTAVEYHGQTMISLTFPNFADLSLNNVKFPDIFTFSRRVATVSVLHIVTNTPGQDVYGFGSLTRVQ